MTKTMLIKNSTKVQLPKTYYKILNLFPAFNDTFVFLGMLGFKKQCITHVDKNGNILFQHIIPKPIRQIRMINNRQCIFLETVRKWHLAPESSQENGPCITILNLQTHQFTRTPHKFLNENTNDSLIYLFYETKLTCVSEINNQQSKHKRFSYYQLPLTQDSVPVNVFEIKGDLDCSKYQFQAVNQHSMIAWFKKDPNEEWAWVFKTYDLRDDPMGKLTVHKINKELGLPQQLSNAQMSIKTLWETSPNCFMIVSESKNQISYKNYTKSVIELNLMYDLVSKTLRPAHFSIGQVEDHIIQKLNFGPVSLFRVFDFRQGRPQATHVYFIDNKKEEIVATQVWEFKRSEKEEFLDMDSGTMIHNQYEQGDCSSFVCESMRVFESRQIALHFMLSINENFDDDLLQEAIELIDYSK